jgi:hypothetical protein
LKLAPYFGLAAMFALLAFLMFGMAGCRTFGEFLDGSAHVNKTTILLAVFVAAGIAGLVTGLLGIIGGAGGGAAAVWLSTTDPAARAQLAPPDVGLPWYLDPWSFIRPVLTWLAIAVALGLFFERSRQQTVQFLKDTLTGHPIQGARRFLAAMGWLHSDPVPPKKHKETP